MTATRDRRSDPESAAEPAWDDRPIFGQFRGLPWWGAVLLAFVPSAIGAFLDMRRQENTLGTVYQIVFVVSCVAAVCLVRRRSLFGPIVQPPLVFAITAVGGVLLLSRTSSGGGLKARIVDVALPLTSNFPTMGITTAVVLAIGLFRWWRERDPDPEMRPNRARVEHAGRDAGLGLDDEPGQDTGGRGRRDRAGKDRAVAPPRRGRAEPADAGRPTPGRTPRPGRESAGGREPRPGRRDPAPGRAGRVEPPPGDGARGRGRGRPADPQPRRREPGAESGRGDREPGRGRGDGRGDGSGRPPRRRPPDDYR